MFGQEEHDKMISKSIAQHQMSIIEWRGKTNQRKYRLTSKQLEITANAQTYSIKRDQCFEMDDGLRIVVGDVIRVPGASASFRIVCILSVDFDLTEHKLKVIFGVHHLTF